MPKKLTSVLATALLIGVLASAGNWPLSSNVSAANTLDPATCGVYVVRPGDSLYRIAQAYGLTVAALQAANGIANPRLIYAGQVLIVPCTSAGGYGVQPAPVPAQSACTDTGVFASAWGAVSDKLGCPTGVETLNGQGSTQSFAGGQMVWLAANQTIYAFQNNGAWVGAADTWQEGNGAYACAAGQAAGVQRGFGKVWCNSATVSAALGRATRTEYATAVSWATFEHGMIIQTDGVTRAVYADGTWEPLSATTALPTGPIAAAPAAPVQQTSASSGAGCSSTYLVRAGDTLYAIALRQGVSPAALLAANQLTPYSTIYPGQRLIIPGAACGAAPAVPGAPALPLATAAPAPVASPTPMPVAGPTALPLPTATSAPVASAGVNHLGTEKVVLADYVMWYGPSVFDGSMTWDVPQAGPYNSDDTAVIQRQVQQAQQACLNGFSAHWYGPNDSRTTGNFNKLLSASAGTGLRHAVVIQTNILPGASEQMIIDAINYALRQWAQQPNYLRLGGRPVIIFTDMPRPWGSDAAALAGWTRIRAATDPNHSSIWMAEGLATTYNPLFDGLYVYRIDHRDYPQSWLKQPRWAAAVRALERQGNLPLGGLYFADTIAAGFDDTRSVNAPGDLRSDAPHFARDRQGGAYYQATMAATAQTGGDFLLVKSFNEWIEGTEIEPGTTYGNLYLDLTCQFANTYRSR